MSRLLACRVCLTYDTRLCSIMDGQLRDIYEKLVEASLVMEDMLPTSVCYICFSFMKKMLQFRERSQKSNQILQQMISSGLEPSVSSLDMLVKAHTGISWTLGISEIVSTTTTSGDIGLIEAPVKIESVKVEIEIDETSEWHEGAAPPEKRKIDENEAENEVVNFQAPVRETDSNEEHRVKREGEKEIPDLTTACKKFRSLTPILKEAEATTSYSIGGEKNDSLESHVKTSHVIELKGKGSIRSDLNVSNEFKSTNLLKLQEIRNNDKRKENNRRGNELRSNTSRYECHYCMKRFTSNWFLSRHLRIHTKVKPFKCDICEKGFTQIDNLTAHLRVHTKQKPFKCDLCEKCFSVKGNLTKHLIVHTKEKAVKCDICDKGFYQKSDLIKHLKVHTMEKPFKCETCKKGFYHRSNFNSHLKVHWKEKPFKCDVCNKGFSQKFNLSAHLKVHAKQKPFKCNICDKGFSHRSSFTAHSRIHTKEKPFKCDTCEKCFAQRTNLTSHLRIHSKEKPFKCGICEKGFAQKSNLTAHISVHSTEKPYKCNECGKCFAQSQYLTRHKRIHSVENLPRASERRDVEAPQKEEDK